MRGLPRYDAKRCYGISVVDPGAVPGGSTNFAGKCGLSPPTFGESGGAETGSTRVIKVINGVRNDTAGTLCPQGQAIINANDNHVVANDNSRLVAVAKAA